MSFEFSCIALMVSDFDISVTLVLFPHFELPLALLAVFSSSFRLTLDGKLLYMP